jgi:Raf kinase inhibitor-like YbhB/YbcL family protein
VNRRVPVLAPAACLLAASVLATSVLAAGCGDRRPTPPTTSAAAGLTVTSTAFRDGGTIPAGFTCAGGRQRPPLAWTGDVAGATTLAVVVDDPDAPGGDFYHWIVVDLPPTAAGITGGLPAGAHQIKNSGGSADWTPPCPPSGTHHYRFTVYGVSTTIGNVPADDAFDAIGRHTVVQGRLTGLVAHQAR